MTSAGTATGSERILVGRPDVALLAKVRRPVVTVWSGRAARAGVPFPAAVVDTGRQELFDGVQVVDWLEATGRGNNPEARADLAAFGAVAEALLHDPAVFAGLTALLCLRVTAGELPTVHDGILDVADEYDPDDEYLYAEIEALGGRLDALARYAGLLSASAYHPAAAFERLLAGRTRSPRDAYALTAVAAPARSLIASLALALGADLPDPVYVDPSPGGSDLLVELADLASDRGSVAVATPDSGGAAGRLALRRLRVHDIVRQPLRDDGHGGFDLPGGAVVLMQLPAPGRPAMSDRDVLGAVEDLVLGSDENVRAVIVGPASALTDRLHGDRAAGAVRDGILRTDRVRGIVRLPAGLLPSRPRSRLGLWCLGPVPDVQRTVVADLTDVRLDSMVAADLVTDLVAGVRGGRALVAHTPRYGRAVATRTVRSRTGDLVVDPPPHSAPAAGTADLLDRAAASTARLAAIPAVTVPIVGDDGAAGSATTLGAAVEQREARVLPGLRLRTEHVDPGGAVRLLGPDELAGARPGRRVDRLVLAAQYPTHTFTEPGDVVFCTAPRPRALVDHCGGAVATFPARVLRRRDPRLVPEALAFDINAQPASARRWRAWPVRRVPADRAVALAAILDDLARHRDAMNDRLDALGELSAVLVDGLTAGTLDLATP